MSAPISSFSKLSLSHEMQAPAGPSRDESRGKGKGTELAPPDDDHSSGSEAGSEDVRSGHIIALDHCRQHGTPDTDQSYYAFQIAYSEVQRYSIRISMKDSGRPICSCEEEGICRHALWLLGQLQQTRTQATEGAGPGVYNHISTLGLGNVCEDLHWELREGPDSDLEETEWVLKKDHQASRHSRHTRAMVRERMKVVRDIMATFSAESTESYRGDIFDTAHDLPDEILVKGDLEATLARLLIRDDDLYYQFKCLVSRNLRATEYFRKMGLKAVEACHLLDHYEEHGPVAGKPDHDLAWCARRLVEIVETISANVVKRQPLSPLSREEAAKSLVCILKDVVVNRNHDVYQNINWPRRRPHGELQIDRNLYQRLIGSTSRSNPSGGSFVTKALEDLPEAQRFVDDLQATLDLLETIGWGPAPQTYRDRLGGLIAKLKSMPTPPPSSSTGKRPASLMERNVKRMK